MYKYDIGDLVIVQPITEHPCYRRYQGLTGRIIKREDVRDAFDRSLVVQYTLEWLDMPDSSSYQAPCGDIRHLFQEDWLMPTTQAEYDAKRVSLLTNKVVDFMEGMKVTLYE